MVCELRSSHCGPLLIWRGRNGMGCIAAPIEGLASPLPSADDAKRLAPCSSTSRRGAAVNRAAQGRSSLCYILAHRPQTRPERSWPCQIDQWICDFVVRVESAQMGVKLSLHQPLARNGTPELARQPRWWVHASVHWQRPVPRVAGCSHARKRGFCPW